MYIQKISMARIRLRSVLKLGFLATLCVSMPIFILIGLNGLAGGSGVTQNGQPVYGVTALVTAMVLGLVFPAVAAVVLTIGAAILRLLGRRAPTISAKVDELADSEVFE